MTPDQALKELTDGNRRFVEQPMTAFNDDLKLLKEKTAGGQAPFAALLSCADSRVPVEFIFDQTIGKLFVTRVAGNIATADLIASLEYGAALLGTKAIMVLGHSNCGAVEATIDGKAVPGQISTLYRSIRPAVDQAGPNLEAAIKANAKIQARLLRSSSPVLAELIGNGRLKIVAAYYDPASGAVTMLEYAATAIGPGHRCPLAKTRGDTSRRHGWDKRARSLDDREAPTGPFRSARSNGRVRSGAVLPTSVFGTGKPAD